VIASVSGVSYADTSVSPSTSYTYFVRAFNASSNLSGPSNSAQVTTPAATVSSGTCPAPARGAFTGCYYPNTTLSGNPTLVRTDSQISFDWANRSPDISLAPGNFSIRWQGNFSFAQGLYNFVAITSDGMRVYIDGTLILNQWRNQPPYMYEVQQTVSQGTHLITVEYYDRDSGATAHLNWGPM